ncbi:hypothetical protein Vadar_017058 [Vaccinium darrowii]|uniref:Uncharacterized protein n=1 Tax=Vaccinium darrowii TaxID=229202 RepID=A0ACB7Z4B4_9ERIC|nr:hypothetical protein Vadar_017058 [Vaccinium darrowii]
MSVSGLNLTEEGNLVLFDRNNTTVWQSFDHPTDSLLLGQNLVYGQKLIASVSMSNWSPGNFVLDAQRTGLYAYLNSRPPMYYYKSTLNWSTTKHLRFENGSFNGLSIPPASSPAQFMKLEPDGHLKVYQWVGDNGIYWNASADLLTLGIGVCGYPLACGKYGVCSNGQCSCPPGEAKNRTSFFRQENNTQPNQGCSLITPISCNNSQYHSLLELQSTSYFNIHQIVYEEKELEDCKKACLNNCSCKAVLFQNVRDSQRGCLLLSEVLTLVNQEDGAFYNSSAFLKVQSYPTVVVPSSKKSRQVTAILIKSGVGAFFGVVAMVVAFLIFLYGKGKESKEVEEIHLNLVPGMLSRFSYEDLKAATNDFTIKLGQGGFGSVFEGTLSNGTKVAVKRLDGLAQLIDRDQSQVVTTMRGTPGYLAPEWLSSSITEKVDVYSFGIMVLEILCGRKNLDRSQPEEDMHLLALFKRKAEEGRLPDIIDKHHDEMQQHEAEVVEMMRIAVWCLQSDYVRRPPMSVVVKVLEGLVDVETNLDYSFTNLAIPRKVGAAGLNEDVICPATVLLPSTLSGPR